MGVLQQGVLHESAGVLGFWAYDVEFRAEGYHGSDFHEDLLVAYVSKSAGAALLDEAAQLA